MSKIGSGLSCLNMEFVTYTCDLGWYIYPSVPKSLAISQETDQKYGPFSHNFCIKLDKLMACHSKDGLSTDMHPWMIGLLVFEKQRHPTKTLC